MQDYYNHYNYKIEVESLTRDNLKKKTYEKDIVRTV